MKFTIHYTLISALLPFLMLNANPSHTHHTSQPNSGIIPQLATTLSSYINPYALYENTTLLACDTFDNRISYVVDMEHSTCKVDAYKGAVIDVNKRKSPSKVINLSFLKNERNPIIEDQLFLKSIDAHTFKILVPEIRAKYYRPIPLDSIGQMTVNGKIHLHLRPKNKPASNCTIVLREKRPEDSFHLLDWGCPTGFSGPDCNYYNPNEIQYLLVEGYSPFDLIGAEIRERNLIGKSYAGGLIFKVDRKKKYGLVVAPDDQSASTPWGCNDVNLADINSIMGDGIANNEQLIASCESKATAIQLCQSLVLNGYNDWYLPCKAELKQIRSRLHEKGMGNFPEGSHYWSSQVRRNKIGYLPFVKNEYMLYVDRAKNGRVRAVRKFEK
ncbi:MAG: hypothetical protein P1U56_26230 [Saprospiraceae bacterium]|nr:hypothetical protein [Saprospiraceae bacterium]